MPGRGLAREPAFGPREVSRQFHHVIDIAPTILEAAGLPEAEIVNGVLQMPTTRRFCSAGWAGCPRTASWSPNKSFSITAEVAVPDSGASGVIIAQGGGFGGFSPYAKDGKPAFCYNHFGLRRFKVYGDEPIPAGEHQIRLEFSYDGGGLGKGGAVALFLDGDRVGEGRVDGTVPMLFSGDETTDVGSDTPTPVSDDYGPKNSGPFHPVRVRRARRTARLM